MYERIPNLELWFPSIKKYLYKTVGQQIESAGFKFNKSEFSFKRKHGKDYEELCFVIQNHFPLNYKVSFVLKIWNQEIKTVKAAFPFTQDIENFKFRSIVIFMGHFMEEMNRTIPGSGLIYDYTLITNKDLFEATDNLLGLLHDCVLPISKELSNLDGIDNFFAKRPGWSVNNLSLNNITTELIAAQLNKKRNFEEVFWQIREEMSKKIAGGEMNIESRISIEQFYKFLMNSY
jgi:hypothetical protein